LKTRVTDLVSDTDVSPGWIATGHLWPGRQRVRWTVRRRVVFVAPPERAWW